jgi:enolase
MSDRILRTPDGGPKMPPLRLGRVHTVEILDSRARPTLAVTLTLSDGTTARAGDHDGSDG